jgi:hypothetical protein
VNLVVLAKFASGKKLPPEGEIAKFSFRCDASWIPVDHGMRKFLSLLGEILPADGEVFNWDGLRRRELLVKFAPQPRPGARNPLHDVRLPPPTDTELELGEPVSSAANSSVHCAPCLPDPAQLPGFAAGSETNPSGRLPVRAVGRARKLLRGWSDICEAVGRRSTKLEHRLLKRLNESQGGPIKHFGRGRPPEVFEEDLLSWWNDLDRRYQAHQERLASAKYSLDRPMHYGRRGEEIFPDLSMRVQRRRQGPSNPADNDQI